VPKIPEYMKITRLKGDGNEAVPETIMESSIKKGHHRRATLKKLTTLFED